VVYEEEDALGYYPDGVKRTLTDEQIAIFRHSEIETLLRERRYADEAKEEDHTNYNVEDGEIDDTEAPIVNDVLLEPAWTQENQDSAVAKKGRRKNKKGGYKQTVKPDLRKRTWDVVEHGLSSLDYGEETRNAATRQESTPQRRRISYDDV